jgi:mannose-1-phosphate guanylyltransferase
MRAMVLAAGLGTRLRPLTNDRPKALVEVGGRTLLEITLTRLRDFGIRDVIINVHHFADSIIHYLRANNNFGMHIEISREDVLLDTGGGLKKAGWFFEQAGKEEPFLLHNVDVISDIDFRSMLKTHCSRQALATLAVQDRPTSRYLLFDQSLQLCGRRLDSNQQMQVVRVVENPCALAFSGIHMISSSLIPKIIEEGAFSIIDTYLRLANEGEKIMAFRADQFYWLDLGRLEHIAQAEQDFTNRVLK